VPLVEQQLPALPVHIRSILKFSGVRVAQFLAFLYWFVDRCLPFCLFLFVLFPLVIVLSVLL